MSDAGAGALVIKSDGLAAFVQAMPAMRAVREAYRGRGVTLLTAEDLKPLAEASPYVDAVDVLPGDGDAKAESRLGQQIKKRGFDLIVDLDANARSERLFNAMRHAKARWSGPARGAALKFERSEDAETHPVDALLAQVAHAGVPAPSNATPDATWAATYRRSAPSLQPGYFSLSERFVLLLPAAHRDGAGPRWPTARFAGLAMRLLEAGVDVAIAAEEPDRVTARAVIEACQIERNKLGVDQSGARLCDLTTRADIVQIAALGCHAVGAFGHLDSGLTHLLAATGTSTISLGRTHDDAEHRAPRGSSVITLVGAEDDPARITMDEVMGMFSMYAGVGAPDRRPSHSSSA